MDRVGHSFPSWSWIPVDIEIVPNEGWQALVHPGNRVGVITGDLACPWSHLLASLPASNVEQRHISRSGFHARLFFPSFQIGAPDRHAGLDPFGAFQLSNVVQDGASNDAVLPIHHAALLASGLRRDVVLHRNAVVHLAVDEEVTPGINVGHGLAVIADLIVIRRSSIGDRRITIRSAITAIPSLTSF